MAKALLNLANLNNGLNFIYEGKRIIKYSLWGKESAPSSKY
jgi:hypothetical protein